MIFAYEIQLADGRTVSMSGRDADHAVARAADLYYTTTVVAWRQASPGVVCVTASQIVG